MPCFVLTQLESEKFFVANYTPRCKPGWRFLSGYGALLPLSVKLNSEFKQCDRELRLAIAVCLLFKFAYLFLIGGS